MFENMGMKVKTCKNKRYCEGWNGGTRERERVESCAKCEKRLAESLLLFVK